MNILNIILGLIFTLTNIEAAEDCQSLKHRIKSECESLPEYQCQSLHGCLVRRDTCFEDGKPKTIEACRDANTCVKDIAAQTPGHEKCEYYWRGDTTTPECYNTPRVFFSTEGCPGRFSGVMGTLAHGFDVGLDRDFNCVGTYNYYQVYIQSCDESKKAFTASCLKSDADRDFLKNIKPFQCEFFEGFNQYRPGQFALDSTYAARINQSSRNHIEEKDSTRASDRKRSDKTSGASR